VNAGAGIRVSWTSALLRGIGTACTSAAQWLEAPSLRAESLDSIEPREHASAHERLSEMRARYY
jgi:hypothetical protein